MSAIFDHIHSMVKEQAREKGLSIEFDQDAVPHWLRGDPTRLIREMDDPKKKMLPILAMTANVFEEDRIACVEAGMQGFVNKPFDLNIFFATILKWLKS